MTSTGARGDSGLGPRGGLTSQIRGQQAADQRDGAEPGIVVLDLIRLAACELVNDALRKAPRPTPVHH